MFQIWRRGQLSVRVLLVSTKSKRKMIVKVSLRLILSLRPWTLGHDYLLFGIILKIHFFGRYYWDVQFFCQLINIVTFLKHFYCLVAEMLFSLKFLDLGRSLISCDALDFKEHWLLWCMWKLGQLLRLFHFNFRKSSLSFFHFHVNHRVKLFSFGWRCWNQ